MGVQLGFMGVQLGGKVIWAGLPGLRLRCGDLRAAAGGCHRASLMMKRRAAATAARPCARPGPGSPLSSFPQVTCLGRPGRPVLPPLFACEMRARPALAVLAWSGDGSPVWGCTTTSGDQVLGHMISPYPLVSGHDGSSPRAQASASAGRSAFRAFLSFLVRALQPKLACFHGDGLGSLGGVCLQRCYGWVPGEGDLVLTQVPDHLVRAGGARYVGSGSGAAPGPHGGSGEQ